MRYLCFFLLVFPSFLLAQKQDVEIKEMKDGTTLILMGVNNLPDQAVNIIAEISSAGYGLKKLETVSKIIPAGGEVELIKLVSKPNRQCSYTASFTYTTKAKHVVKLVETREVQVDSEPEMKDTKVESQTNHKTAASNPSAAVMNKKGIVVYSKNGCGRCDYITNYFEENEIAFTDANISSNKKDKEEMSKVLFASGYKGGSFTTPVVIVDGKVHYNIKDIKAFVKDIKDKNLK